MPAGLLPTCRERDDRGVSVLDFQMAVFLDAGIESVNTNNFFLQDLDNVHQVNLAVKSFTQ